MPRYDFVSGGAMAGNAIQQFLMQREMERRQALLDQIAQQERGQNNEIQERSMRLQEQERQDRLARQAQIDQQQADARDAATRQQGNQAGVRDMMATAMQDGLTPDKAKTIGVMAFREGMEAPPQIQQMQEAESEAQKRSAGLADYEARQMIDASTQPKEDRYRTVGGSIFDAESRQFMTPPERGGSGGGSGDAPQSKEGDASQEYGIQTADRVIAAIDGVLPKINDRTAGIVGNATTRLGINQEGINVSAELETVAGNIAFNALQQMRAASKTGGALGNVANQELQLLKGIEGSIRQDQSPANLKAQLQKVRESMERFRAAQIQPGGGSGGGSFRVVGRRPK